MAIRKNNVAQANAYKEVSMKGFIAFMVYLISAPVNYAHHDFFEDINLSSLYQFSGTVMGLQWDAPHVLIRVIGNPDLSSSPQWLIEIDSPEQLLSNDISMEMFDVFSRISIVAYPSKAKSSNGERYMYGLYFADTPTNMLLLNEELYSALPTLPAVKYANGLH